MTSDGTGRTEDTTERPVTAVAQHGDAAASDAVPPVAPAPGSRRGRALRRVQSALPSAERRAEVRLALAQRRALGRGQASAPTLDQLLEARRAAAATGGGTAEPAPATATSDDDPSGGDGATSGPEATQPDDPATPETHGGSSAHEHPGSARFGVPGRDFDRGHPFYVGFVGALGVLIAIALVELLGNLSNVITLLVVALFLALALEPVVEWLGRRGIRRGGAIGLVFLAVVAVFVGFGFMVVPILIDQGAQLATTIPQYFQQVQSSDWFTDLDRRYDLVGRVTEELEQRVADGQTMSAIAGGVLGAGQALLGGVFSALTVLILTLYFLASMRTLRSTTYDLVPSSRRERVQLLGDEISRRIGGYVMGQLAIATLNGILSYVMMLVLDIPYPAVLAIAVGLVGLIPLVGATIGAVLVVAVALFISLPTALIVLVYYLVYQQVENYVIAPKIMARTVSVPGGLAIVAALTGGSLLGALGALIAIPIAAGILLVVQEVVMPRQNRL